MDRRIKRLAALFAALAFVRAQAMGDDNEALRQAMREALDEAHQSGELVRKKVGDTLIYAGAGRQNPAAGPRLNVDEWNANGQSRELLQGAGKDWRIELRDELAS